MRQERLQVNYTVEDFIEEEMRMSLQRYQASIDLVSNEIIKSPEMFKEKVKWRDFSEAFMTYMQNMKGQCDFSLAYILRDNDDNKDIVPQDYDTIGAFEEAIIPFSGPFYELDNNAVFDSLKSYILGGPHWTWIQDYERKRDGRAAWKTLKNILMVPTTKFVSRPQHMLQLKEQSIREPRISTTRFTVASTRRLIPTLHDMENPSRRLRRLKIFWMALWNHPCNWCSTQSLGSLT
jgi:hypothetical protein